MNRISGLVAPLALATALSLAACSNKTDIDVNTDSTAANDTMTLTPADTGMPSAVDTGAAYTDTTGNLATGAKNEGVEKLVEAQLAISPGFENVKVESEGNGVIVLNGTVASDAEKANAETEAKKVAGVNSVKNNLTVK
jgi:hypothetical protein